MALEQQLIGINKLKMNNFLRITQPNLGEEELKEVRKVFNSGYLTGGPKVEEFESVFAKFIGTKYAFSTTSATTALHLSLVTLGIGRGDEVLIPDFTFPATANVVMQVGAKPILVDIDLDTFNISFEDLEKKISNKTRAIIPVHLFGMSADMDPIIKLAKKKGLKVLEDAACASGTTYKNRMCGSLGDLGCFSFHPRKIITTGEGGMITTNNFKLADKIRLYRNHGGIRKKGRYTFVENGFNYRVSDIAAAIGLVQMQKIKKLIAKREKIAKLYKKHLNQIPGVKIPQVPSWGNHIYQSYVVLLDKKINRDKIIEQLKKAGVESTIGTYSIHTQPFFYKKYGNQTRSLPNSYIAFKQSLALPFHAQLTETEIDFITRQLLRLI